jgi:hypothetical protein
METPQNVQSQGGLTNSRPERSSRTKLWLWGILALIGASLGVSATASSRAARRSFDPGRRENAETVLEEDNRGNLAANAISPGDQRYLALLKRSLTATIFNQEPDCNQPDQTRFVMEFDQHYMKGQAVSMLPLARLDHLQQCIVDVVANRVPGDLIESGAWRGGATILMRAVLRALGVRDRTVWVADSFEGLPEPDAEKYPLEAKAYKGPVMTKAFKHLAVELDEVRRNFQAYHMLDEQVRFLKGWFKDTLPNAPIERLAILRVDGDYYESTMDALRYLYPRLSIGGYVIVDDYGEESWTYCRNAVDHFRANNGITDAIVHVDSRCVFWQRTA